jgi:pSer/pThr/pTyr-binding forkhead associated (FHA) protein
MMARTVGELLATWYGREMSEFLDVHPDPVLIGVGILDVKLLRDPHRHGSTLCLGFEQVREDASHPPDPLVGIILPVVARSSRRKGHVVIGRAASCDVVVEDPSVSERHCVVEDRGGVLTVVDQGSTNGTLINGTPLEPSLAHTLRDEDVLTLGRHSFQYFTPAVLFQYLQLSPQPR